MPKQGTWRISAAYDYVYDLDAPDLAWEFLRRNPEYQQDYVRLNETGLREGEATAVLSDKWGLSFRGQPRHPLTGSQPRVDDKSRSLDTDPLGLPPINRTARD